jgi:hypothetical protein
VMEHEMTASLETLLARYATVVAEARAGGLRRTKAQPRHLPRRDVDAEPQSLDHRDPLRADGY